MFDTRPACSREVGVSGPAGRHPPRRLGLDADRVPADLAGEGLGQLEDGLDVPLLRRVVAVQPPCAAPLRH